jgi:hypothetical protein
MRRFVIAVRLVGADDVGQTRTWMIAIGSTINNGKLGRGLSDPDDHGVAIAVRHGAITGACCEGGGADARAGSDRHSPALWQSP